MNLPVTCTAGNRHALSSLLAPFPSRVSTGWMTACSLGAALIIAYGWSLRESLPHYPLWNPDTWGYLHPALSWINGQAFQQTAGRHGFYPSLLILFLSLGKGFAGIALAQQAMGVVSGLLFWWGWVLWWGILPASRLRDVLVPAPGLLVLALYYWNPSTVYFELGLRPEGVFPFFGFAQLASALIFIRLISASRTRRGLTVFCGALSLLLAVCCFWLKPSWAFALVFTSLPVAAALVFARGRRAEALAALVAGALAAAGMSAAYKAWMRPDFASISFLPNTLLTIHADLIAEQMAKADFSLAGGGVKKEFVENLEKELSLARAKQHSFKVLGFDPDYLMYQSSVDKPLIRNGMSREQVVDFYYRAYFDVWLGNPAGMARKILRQIAVFALPNPDTILSNEKDFQKEYDKTRAAADGAVLLPPGPAESLLAENRLAGNRLPVPGPVLRSPWWLRSTAKTLSGIAPVLVGLFAAAFCAQCLRRSAMVLPGLTASLLFSAPLGNALAVCIIHSLDIDRYRRTYGPFLALALAAMLVYVIVSAVQFLCHAVSKDT